MSVPPPSARPAAFLPLSPAPGEEVSILAALSVGPCGCRFGKEREASRRQEPGRLPGRGCRGAEARWCRLWEPFRRFGKCKETTRDIPKFKIRCGLLPEHCWWADPTALYKHFLTHCLPFQRIGELITPVPSLLSHGGGRVAHFCPLRNKQKSSRNFGERCRFWFWFSLS